MRLEDTETDDEGEAMVLYCARRESEFRIASVPPTAERVGEIQQELARKTCIVKNVGRPSKAGQCDRLGRPSYIVGRWLHRTLE
jgi:hypothetical protein